MAPFEINLRRRNIPDNEILEDIRAVAKKLEGKAPTRIQYEEHGNFGPTTIIRRFGSWKAGLLRAGLDINFSTKISDEELFQNLAELWQRLGKQPVGKDVRRKDTSKYALATYEKRFGSWNNALIAFSKFIICKDIQEISTVKKRTTKVTNNRTPRGINWRLRASVLIRDNCICKMCGSSPAKDPETILHADHIIPWSKGGETVMDNLQTLCQTCNIGKSNELFNRATANA